MPVRASRGQGKARQGKAQKGIRWGWGESESESESEVGYK